MEKSIFVQKREGWTQVSPKDPEVQALMNLFEEKADFKPTGVTAAREVILFNKINDALMNLFEEMADFKPTGVTAAGEKTKVVGDSNWTILDSKDPAVIEIGKFAVAEHNKKAGTNLVFVEVVSHSKLGVLKFYFHVLSIRTNDGIHKALVFEAPFGYKKLLFWIN